MDKITSDVRRQQWLDIIQACNASGLTKKAWCEQNGINIKSFYYWQRQLRHETYDVQSAALSPEPEVTFAEIAVPSSPKNIVDQTMTIGGCGQKAGLWSQAWRVYRYVCCHQQKGDL